MYNSILGKEILTIKDYFNIRGALDREYMSWLCKALWEAARMAN